MVITVIDGNVGIGTSSTSDKFDVYGTRRMVRLPRVDFFCTNTGRSLSWGTLAGSAGDYSIYSNSDDGMQPKDLLLLITGRVLRTRPE